MANPLGVSFLVTILLVASVVSSSAVLSGNYQLGWAPAQPSCTGTISECLAGEEFGMNSEINRRILAATRYISYEALKRNSVPCSRRGNSYYNCKPGAAANPYNRGCSKITRCRS